MSHKELPAAPDAHPRRCVPSAVVRYRGATNTFGSRWQAVIDRGGDFKVRASVPFYAGPDAAVDAVLAKLAKASELKWRVIGPALSLDGGDTYAYPVADPALAGPLLPGESTPNA
jgi:hypothetical protein